MGKPRGYSQYMLVADCETTGIAYGCDDPSFDPSTNQYYQSVSWGLIVAETETFEPIDQLYVEIKWDGKSVWDKEAEQVHGLTKNYLDFYGINSQEAVIEIGNLVYKYWGADKPIMLLGHNVVSFDKPFLQRLMRSEGIDLRFGNRHIDTCSIGLATFGTYNSDDLFEAAGLPKRDPSHHNALEDANYSLSAARTVKQLWQGLVAPEL